MATNKYFPIPFSAGIKQSIPKQLLPVPFLTKASNFIIKEQGQLTNRPLFQEIGKLPSDRGKPLKLFTYDNGLYLKTTQFILRFEEPNNWIDISNTSPSDLVKRENVSSEIFRIAQKETDIKNLAFAKWAVDTLCFFYTYEQNPGVIYCSLWNTKQKRLISLEKSFSITGFDSSQIRNMFALYDDPVMWLGINYGINIIVIKINPTDDNIMPIDDEISRPDPPISGVQRFKLFKDRVFYTTDGKNIGNFVFNEDRVDKAQPDDVSIDELIPPAKTYLRDPAKTSESKNLTLYDFKDWTDFKIGDKNYKIVWSLNTGYFLLNENGKIIAHLYSNLLPETETTEPRIQYLGDAYVDEDENKVYVPILRSGHIEAVNRSAISDKVLPGGREQLVAFRPLGLDLLVFDMESEITPDFCEIGKSALISGPVLNWLTANHISEYGFTEKPTIKKNPKQDYDKWAYSDITFTEPVLSELNATQYTEVTVNIQKRISPYLLDEVVFVSGATGSGVQGWKTDSTVAKRTLRYSSFENSPNILDPYNGVLSEVNYNVADKAIEVKYTSAPSSLADGKDHPQGIMINGVKYDFHTWEVSGGVLTAKHYIDDNPFTSGREYTIIQPKADILRPSGNLNLTVKDDIDVKDVRLRKYQRVFGANVIRASARVGNTQLRFGSLNNEGHRGAVNSGIRALVGISQSTGQIFGTRDSTKDISWRSRSGLFSASVSDGETIWFVDDNTSIAYAYRASDRARDSSKDIRLPSGGIWNSAVSDGTTLWFVNTNDNKAYAYRASTQIRDESKDIGLLGDNIFAGASDGTTLWFVSNDDNKAYAYRASDRARDSGKDINLPSECVGGFGNNNTIWFILSGSKTAQAYNSSGERLSTSDITFQDISSREDITTNVESAVLVGTTVWIPINAGVINFRAWNIPSNIGVSDGTITNPEVQADPKIDIKGVWYTGNSGDFYIVFEGKKGNYANGQALSVDIEKRIGSFVVSVGEDEFIILREHITGASKTYYEQGSFVYARYLLRPLSTNPGLRNILQSDGQITLESRSQTGERFIEETEDISPRVLSVIYETDNEKEVNDFSINLRFLKPDNVNEHTSVFFNKETFKDLKNNEYYFATTNNPLSLNEEVFNFNNDNLSVILRYPLVPTSPDLSAGRLLSSYVYNYKTRFKWLDENGQEHRSQFSDILQIITNRPIGQPGNQPSFDVNLLNLTNKPKNTVSVELYRTQRGLQTFQYVTEVKSDTKSEQTTIIDDFTDDRLGAPADNEIISTSGAKFCESYKGRFVLYGFSENPNRILISSPKNPFDNKAISFKITGTIGSVIEILMNEAIIKIEVLDESLIIFTEKQTYIWTLNENSTIQQQPALVSGLTRFTVDNVNSSIWTNQGIIFNAKNGEGIQMLTRGLNWSFVGEDVKDVTNKGKVISSVNKSENIFFFMDMEDQEQPQVLIYNQRYKLWTSYDDKRIVSAVIWNGRLTAINSEGQLKQENLNPTKKEIDNSASKYYIVETGWLNLTEGFLNFQRLREVYLQAEFKGLQLLNILLDYDYIIEGEKSEGKNLKVSETKKNWRFQPRNQGCTAVRIRWTIVAKEVKLNILRLGGDWQSVAKTQYVKTEIQPATNPGANG